MSKNALDAVHTALLTLVAIEPDPATIASAEEYLGFMTTHADAEEQALRILRQFAQNLTPKTRLRLQEMWEHLTQDPRYTTPYYARSTVMGSLNTAWRDVHGWVS